MYRNGNPHLRWETAERHYHQMAAKYVIPAIQYAHEMASRPWYSDLRLKGIIDAIHTMEAVRRLYTGPLCRNDEASLAEADKAFRAAMAKLQEWDQ